ncbi:CLC_0170 family protein [Paenibacillus alkalitolerans]|uniref:CLC_0170 family protein n=1 Tax=Paenibacillus alkalitolerans TaxID=2799335 RepID=UPI0018F4A57D|nr:CLC_0170 family protein [Paenibacillus alkalitolerans]
MINTYIGHFTYIILLFLLTGAGMLAFDVKDYDKQKMHKEKKTARILGWFNIILGAIMLAGNWIIQGMMQ